MKRSKPKGSAAWTAKVAPDITYEDLVQTQTDLYPGKSVTSVIMGSPTCYLDAVNGYVTDLIKTKGAQGLYCTSYKTTKREIVNAMAQGYLGIKPYLANCAPYIPASEIRIFDFLPH